MSSHPHGSTAASPIQIPHRSRLTALVALAAGLTILVLATTLGTGNNSGSVSEVSTVPQYRDVPPSPSRFAQIERAATPTGYVRDPRTHALLKIQTGTESENAQTGAPAQTVPPHVERLLRLER